MKKVAKTLGTYDHLKIEKKWQAVWRKKKLFETKEVRGKKKAYVLDMFPYPSGAGLHVGHPRSYVASDAYARYLRMKGYNVLHPMGYDAFGLPAEQYAIQHKMHPEKAVLQNITTFKKQLEKIGFSYDWSREVNTTDPKYYKWTQWIFLQLYNSYFNTAKNKAEPIANLVKQFAAKGSDTFTAKDWKSYSEKQKQDILMQYRLAYEGYSEVNWCPELGTVLANDEVIEKDGKMVSERGEYPVEKKSLRQWFLRISAYADRLLSGLEGLDWSEHIKEIQKNWIGKSEGAEITFALKGRQEKITVFTTRADTLFGVTYVVLAPEAELVQKLLPNIANKEEVLAYIAKVKSKAEQDRIENKEKTGVELKGIKAINPANNEEVPVWIADYVLASYGTGMVMAVPAHDERDFAFAKKYGLPMKEVIVPQRIDKRNPPVTGKEFIARRNVHAIVRNPKDNTYLCLKWKKHAWTTFPMGGIEDNENPIEAARREVIEETGYKNLTNPRILGGQVKAQYFAAHKDVNRISYTYAVSFDLVDTEQVEVSAEEKDQHEPFWMEKKDMTVTSMTHAEMDIWLARLFSPDAGYYEDGVVINTGLSWLDGLLSEDARLEIIEELEYKGVARAITKYKMRDAVFARQRYWGEPIPLIHKKDGIIEPLKENKLPLKLPKVKSYEPIGTGESPLAGVKDWVKKGYETNTMPGWAGSSWYFLRYMDPKNSKKFASEKALKYWKQVDMYVGGAEHATGHLLYARFWNKFLHDLGFVPSDEPFKALRNQGMVLGSDSRKMSKRWGNVVNPDDVVRNVGADTLRLYTMFMGPFTQEIPWSTDGAVGCRRFLERVWKLSEKVSAQQTESEEVEILLNQTIKKVEEDLNTFSNNTAVSALMILGNLLEKQDKVSAKTYLAYLKILSPFAPHIAEELTERMGEKKSLVYAPWPKVDRKKLVAQTVNIAIQINGKVRGIVLAPLGAEEGEVETLARANPDIVKWLSLAEIRKKIFVKNKILNFVVSA